MTIKKRSLAASAFGHTPHNAITGGRETLLNEQIYPYCAMVQVAKKDTHCNYVVCRLYDPRNRKYYNYDTGDEDQDGIPVAKPYWNRMKGVYRIGQVFPAFLCLSAGAEQSGIIVPSIGQNPGYAEPDGTECKGHPEALTEEIKKLTDDGNVYINWMLIDGGKERIRFCAKEAHPGVDTVFEVYGPGEWNSATREWEFTCDTDHTHKAIDKDHGMPEPAIYFQGYADWEADDEYGRILVVVTTECEAGSSPC